MQHIRKYGPLVIIAVIIVFVGSLIYAKNSTPASQTILFYSITCPHCQNVEAFITASHLKDRFKFQELEVSQNQDNATLLASKTRQCHIDTSQGVGVPFLVDGTKCLVGDQDIIAYLQQK
jgi:glutaredoxin